MEKGDMSTEWCKCGYGVPGQQEIKHAPLCTCSRWNGWSIVLLKPAQTLPLLLGSVAVKVTHTALSQVAPRDLYKSVRKMLGGNYSHAIILTCELSGWEEAQVSKHGGTQAFGCGREPALLHSWLLGFQMWQMFCQCKLLTWKLSRTAQEAMF